MKIYGKAFLLILLGIGWGIVRTLSALFGRVGPQRFRKEPEDDEDEDEDESEDDGEDDTQEPQKDGNGQLMRQQQSRR